MCEKVVQPFIGSWGFFNPILSKVPMIARSLFNFLLYKFLTLLAVYSTLYSVGSSRSVFNLLLYKFLGLLAIYLTFYSGSSGSLFQPSTLLVLMITLGLFNLLPLKCLRQLSAGSKN